MKLNGKQWAGICVSIVGVLFMLFFAWLTTHTLNPEATVVKVNSEQVAVVRNFQAGVTGALVESTKEFLITVDDEPFASQQADNSGVPLQYHSLLFQPLPGETISVVKGEVRVSVIAGNTVLAVIPDPGEPPLVAILGILVSFGLSLFGAAVVMTTGKK